MSKILIVGGNGFIGKCLQKKLYNEDISLQTSKDWIVPSNITDKTIVIYLRSISSPSFVNLNKELSYDINVNRTSKFIDESLNLGARVIFFSSDVVYGNSLIKRSTETKNCNPYGVYAKQKNIVENFFLSSFDFISIRVSQVVGPDSKIFNILRYEKKPKIPNYVFRNVINIRYVTDFVENLLHLSKWRTEFPLGIVNLGGAKTRSIYQVSKMIAENYQLNFPDSVKRDKNDKISRPFVVRMDSTKAETFLGKKFTDII
jgi:dTDP-4-dehydrorhamnose reductase